jgi:hypothetical protein
MRKVYLQIMIVFAMTASGFAGPQFDRFFVEKTMRVDYYHTGTATTEIFSLDQVYEQPIWAGSKVNLIDTLNLGKYMVKVFDLKTNRMIYSRGYCTIFGEWQTTDEAKEKHGTFHESVLFPFPKRQVQVVIAARDKRNYFVDKYTTIIDPNSRFVNREKSRPKGKITEVMKNGDPACKVDVVILAEGYNMEEQEKFDRDVKKYIRELFKVSPFKERKKDFNVYSIGLISQDSGIDEPRQNIWKNTALGASYNSLDSPRYVLSTHNKAIRDAAAHAPYDQIYILFNSKRYGGGGIYNWFSTCHSDADMDVHSFWPIYVFVHEFGHAFGGLADEYYSSSVAYSEFYPLGVEPWEPNITALVDKQHPKWGSMIAEDTPIPTPWAKAQYDSLNLEVRKLDKKSENYEKEYIRLQKEIRRTLESDTYAGKVGVFEGAGYASKGLYRSGVNCRMFTKSLTDFCPVCRATIEKVIDFYCK